MKKYIIRTIILLTCVILAMTFPGCNRYFTPDKYANPRGEFEKEQRRYEKKLMKKERQNTNIDPLKWNK
jgi:hypothetical protein